MHFSFCSKWFARLVAACFLISSVSSPACGDIILNSITGSVSASMNSGPPNTGSYSTLSGSISRTFTFENSFTTSSENHTWSGTGLTQSLTGAGLVTEEKTVSAKPGGSHEGTSTLTVVFTTTSATNLSLAGNWGFVGNTGTVPDSIGWTLVGPSTNMSQSAPTSGGTGQPFSASTTLGIGTFTFTITANFNETINNQGTRTADWNLTSFQLSSATSVPEPGVSSLALAGLLLASGWRRWRRA